MSVELRKLLRVGRLIYEAGKAVMNNPRRLVNVARSSNVKNFLVMLRNDDHALLRHRLKLYFGQQERSNALTLPATESITLPIRLPIVDSPRVSILVPAYNNYEHTLTCLSAIAKNTQGISYEVLLADDGSTDETLHIQDVVHGLRVVRPEANLGFLRNCNHAAREAHGEILVLLNNDTVVQPGWLDAMVNVLDRDAQVGMVGSKLIFPDDTVQEAGGIIWRDGSAANYGRGLSPENPEVNYLKEVDYVSGASLAIRSTLWRQIGGFDERFCPAYYEDVDLAFEVRASGYRVIYQPRSHVVHLEGASHGTDVSVGIKRHQETNRHTFYQKWHATLAADHAEGPASIFAARDRSVHRQTILVVDLHVPRPDHDAGSRMVDSYLRLLVRMGYNVKFLGDHFFIEEPYTSALEQIGIEVLFGDWFRHHHRSWIVEHLPQLDHVLLCRPDVSTKYIDLFEGKLRGKILYLGLDLHYLREERRFAVEGDARVLAAAQAMKELEISLITRADVSLTPSELERALIAELCPNKAVETVPLFLYESNDRVKEGFSERADVAFVGGFGHAPNVQGMLWFIEEVWPTLKHRLNCRLHVIGPNPPDSLLALQSHDVMVTGGVSDAQLSDYYRTCRVFVAPLRFGAGVKGKVVEAMKHQVPIVSTSIGFEGLPGGPSHPFLRPCDDPESFAAEVERLYTDESAWVARAEAYVEYINQHFMVDGALRQMTRLLSPGSLEMPNTR